MGQGLQCHNCDQFDATTDSYSTDQCVKECCHLEGEPPVEIRITHGRKKRASKGYAPLDSHMPVWSPRGGRQTEGNLRLHSPRPEEIHPHVLEPNRFSPDLFTAPTDPMHGVVRLGRFDDISDLPSRDPQASSADDRFRPAGHTPERATPRSADAAAGAMPLETWVGESSPGAPLLREAIAPKERQEEEAVEDDYDDDMWWNMVLVPVGKRGTDAKRTLGVAHSGDTPRDRSALVADEWEGVGMNAA